MEEGEKMERKAIEISLSLFSLFYTSGQVILPVVVDVVVAGGDECIFEHLNDLVA